LFLGIAIGGLVLVAVAAVLVTQLLAGRSSAVEFMNDSLQEAFGAIEMALPCSTSSQAPWPRRRRSKRWS
jgi:hypothetical protein